MGNSSLKTRLIVPLLAFVFALAFAPAAFATDLAPANGEGDEPPALDKATVALSGYSFVYSGRPITPGITVTLDGKKLAENTDYWKFYDNNVNVGTAEAWVYNDTGDDEVVPSNSKEFKIVQASIRSAKIKLANEVYTGKRIKPLPLVTYNGITLKKGVDYTLSYGKNKKVGKGKVVITGKGNFKGKITKKFKITKASLKNAKVSSVKDKEYTGNWIRPNVKVKFNGKKLKKGRDYTVKYTKNKNVGVAKIKITGKGNFKGKRTVQFAITPRPISDCNAYLNSSPYWTGSPVEPAVKVTFRGRTLDGDDYLVHYRHGLNCSLVGATDKVTIYGTGNYRGSRSISYTVLARPISNSAVSVSITQPVPKTATDMSPYVRVFFNNGYRTYQLTYGVDYDLGYPAMKSKNGSVQVKGMGHFKGSRTETFSVS